MRAIDIRRRSREKGIVRIQSRGRDILALFHGSITNGIAGRAKSILEPQVIRLVFPGEPQVLRQKLLGAVRRVSCSGAVIKECRQEWLGGVGNVRLGIQSSCLLTPVLPTCLRVNGFEKEKSRTMVSLMITFRMS